MGLRFSKGLNMSQPVKHPTGKVCKFCKVDVFIKDGKAYPVLGKQHKPSCPRARNCN
jgi:hypothetical protein